jgi:hypothetical protein
MSGISSPVMRNAQCEARCFDHPPECEVLRGGVKILGYAKAVITEVSFKEFYKGQCRFDQLASFLAEAGLFVYVFGLRTAVGKLIE